MYVKSQKGTKVISDPPCSSNELELGFTSVDLDEELKILGVIIAVLNSYKVFYCCIQKPISGTYFRGDSLSS